MDIKDALAKIGAEGGEIFIKARDVSHAKSMRVTAFNLRRKMPKHLINNIGVQACSEGDLSFLRIFDRKIDGAEIYVRDKETGKLIPAPQTELGEETKRIVEMMRADGKTEEEIQEIIGYVEN